MWSMPILAGRGVIQVGTKIELVPDPKRNVFNSVTKKSRAIVKKPSGGRDSIEWQNESHSPSSLLNKLERDLGFNGLYGVCRNWRIVGHQKSLREEV